MTTHVLNLPVRVSDEHAQRIVLACLKSGGAFDLAVSAITFGDDRPSIAVTLTPSAIDADRTATITDAAPTVAGLAATADLMRSFDAADEAAGVANVNERLVPRHVDESTAHRVLHMLAETPRYRDVVNHLLRPLVDNGYRIKAGREQAALASLASAFARFPKRRLDLAVAYLLRGKHELLPERAEIAAALAETEFKGGDSSSDREAA